MRLALAGLAFAAAAFTGTAAAAPPEPVSFDFDVAIVSGDTEAGTTAGTFTADGAVVDTGTTTTSYRFSSPGQIHVVQTLSGSAGSLELRIQGHFDPFVGCTQSGTGRWVIVSGTGAYEHLHGEGSWSASADFCAAFAGTGPPTISGTYSGTAHVD
jgi:hypothetical protein